jgi:hypothetical protein
LYLGLKDAQYCDGFATPASPSSSSLQEFLKHARAYHRTCRGKANGLSLKLKPRLEM